MKTAYYNASSLIHSKWCRHAKDLRLKYMLLYERTPAILVAARSKAEVCSRSIAGIAGSNPVEGTDVRLLCLLCSV